MTVLQLKKLLGRESIAGKAAHNAAIRRWMPGGNELLDICERLHQSLHGRPDEMLQDLLDKAIDARDKMVEAFQESEDGIIVRIPNPNRLEDNP